VRRHSRGRTVSIQEQAQALNNRNQEDRMTSTSDLRLDERRGMLKVATSNSENEQKKVEWPRKRTLLGKERDKDENT
jgi:hypothetical protein